VRGEERHQADTSLLKNNKKPEKKSEEEMSNESKKYQRSKAKENEGKPTRAR
jgi:hypothetical protein